MCRRFAAADGKFTIQVGNGASDKNGSDVCGRCCGRSGGLIGSSGYLEIAVNKGNAARAMGAARGVEVVAEVG